MPDSSASAASPSSRAPGLLMSAEDMASALDSLAGRLLERHGACRNLALIGIQRRGVSIAEELRGRMERKLGEPVLAGSLDITLYRDDISVLSDQPVVHSTSVPGDITGKKVVLVDDVLFTGRTVRAALDAITDLGRPERVQLAVLVDRGHRELPIAADYVGKTVPTSRSENVEVRVKELDGEDRVVICERTGGTESGVEA